MHYFVSISRRHKKSTFKIDKNKRDLYHSTISTFDFQCTITSICSKMFKRNLLGREVSKRIEFGKYLPVVDVVYHQVYNVNFSVKAEFEKKQRLSVGRPENVNRTQVFLKVGEHLEDNNGEQKKKCRTAW